MQVSIATCCCLASRSHLDLAAHLEAVRLALDDVGARHQEERLRRLQLLEER